jgi:hypothetical protein
MEVTWKCLAEYQTSRVRMLEEITGISMETLRKILVEDLEKRSVCSLCFSFVNSGSKTSTLCWNLLKWLMTIERY